MTVSKPARSLIFIAFLFCLNVGIAGGVVVAQENATRPVARLIASGNPDSYDRPRRASTGEVGKPNGKLYPTFEQASSIERRAFQLTNEARVKQGLKPLSWDPELCHLARIHSEKMARQRFFSHTTPEGQRVRDRALAMGIPRFRVIAENIAYNQGYEDPAAFAVHRWMISAGHRANILYIDFQNTAVGVFVSEDGSVYFTQAFIAR